jgi:hypothetical protein
MAEGRLQLPPPNCRNPPSAPPTNSRDEKRKVRVMNRVRVLKTLGAKL